MESPLIAGIVKKVYKDIDTPYGNKMIWYAAVEPFFNDNNTIYLPIIECEKTNETHRVQRS